VYLLVFHAYFIGILIFKGLTARRLYKSFGVKGLINANISCNIKSYFITVRNGNFILYLKQLEVVIQVYSLVRTVPCVVFIYSPLLFPYVTLKVQACKFTTLPLTKFCNVFSTKGDLFILYTLCFIA
jgi:hypothetical protein